jgi:type IV pilus assembly protein PilM
MAARLVGVWGIDLGQCALKAIRLEMKDGAPVATAFEYIEHPKILSQPDADPDELSREALTQFLSRNQIRGDIIAISVPGQSGLARFVKLPPVDEKKIADIVKFEAKQQIPFPLEEVVWDFQRLNKGDVIDGLALETEIGLFAMKRDMVTRAIQQFKEVGVEVHLVQMAPLALCNFVSYDLLGKSVDNLAEETDDAVECIVALEIGTDSSNLVITNGGRIIWQRPIPIGGNHFTRALTKEMKLTFAKAEHLKKNAAKSPDLKKILSSLKQVLNDFVGEVQRSLGYFTNTHRNAQVLYIIGLGNAFRLPGLQKFLQEKLQLEVRKFKALEHATGESVTTAPTFAENIMSFGVAYGLALQGLKQARLQTNLLPYEVRFERVIRGKKPWVVAAAACLLFGMCMLAFAQGIEKRAVESEEIKDATKGALAVATQATKYKNEYAEKEKELKDRLASLNRIGAGVPERINWQLLHQYVNMASPQPNGERLSEDPVKHIKLDLWTNKKEAKDAFAKYEERRFGKVKDKKPEDAAKDDEFIKKNLIQINIVGVNALYSDDLSSYFRFIADDRKPLEGMAADDKRRVIEFATEKDPEKLKKIELPREGWVVEVRGFTYHQLTNKFVEKTIVENLKFPVPLNDSKKEKEMASRIKDRVGYMLIYFNHVVPVPEPGKFEYVGKSYLKAIFKGADNIGAGPVIANPQNQPPPQPGPAVAEKPKVSRTGWRPIGEVAIGVFGDGAMPAQPNPPEKGVANIVPRTEFVILFVWQEPIISQQPISIEDKK